MNASFRILRPKFIYVCAMVSIIFSGINLQAQVELREQEWVIPSYKVNPPEKNPMFFKSEVYQGASKYIYPYKLIDNLSDEKADKAWKALILENEYIKLCITPEIGGKLYYGTDKTNDYNFIYKNNVVKPANIGMLGAWVSGGIEWCVIHHHRASTYLPVDYDLIENEDGSKTIWIGETEPRHGMRWTIGITVFPGKSYYQTEVRIHNGTPFTQSFLYWANVAVSVNDDYQVIFPPSVNTVTYHAKNSFARWPVSHEVYNNTRDYSRGVDISWWKNSPASVSFFAHDLKEDFMGGYDHGKETGTVHIGDHNIVKGAKLWEWGSGPNGQATEAKLTESDGPYAEIMVGAFSDNQPDYSWIQPYEVKNFKQYWYPVKDIEGFKYANLNGAVNLEQRDGNTVFLGFYSTQKIAKARILLKNKDLVIFEKIVEISPEKPFTRSIEIEGTYDMTGLSTEMTNAATNESLVSYHPVKPVTLETLPEIVKRPSAPEEIKTVEELYLTGQRIQQFYNPSLNAMLYYEEALKRDPSDIRTNIALGKTALKNGDYVKARNYFTTAIKRITKDYTRPLDCEVLYLQGITLKALGLYDEAVDTLYRATWDYAWHSAAYLELARISCEQGNFEKALLQIEESLSTNTKNNSAINLKASVLRKLNDFEAAASTLAPLKSDPLDFRTCNENYLIANEQGDRVSAENILVSLNKKMRGFDQNYLNLSIDYLNDGLLSESEDVLLRFRGSNQLVDYYLGYISDRKGDKEQAEILFSNGSIQKVDYCFPYRLEEIKILNKALEYNEMDANALYYLGNLLYDKQPAKAIEYWEKAVLSDPGFAIAYRNLGWGYHRNDKNVPKAISAYEKAIANNPVDPVYYAELDPLYELENVPVEKRMALFEPVHEVVKNLDDASIREIKVLILGGMADKALEYLSGRFFSYREGSSRVRNITVDAYLMSGINFMKEKKYNEALKQFLEANVLGDDSQDDSRSGDERTPQVEYFIGLAYEALGENEKAMTSFGESVTRKIQDSNYVAFYKGLSYLKLKNKEKADEIFRIMIRNGEELVNKGDDVDFFAKFGESESKNTFLSQAYLLKGLGYKGLGDTKQARENLDKAILYSNSNLWAIYEN